MIAGNRAITTSWSSKKISLPAYELLAIRKFMLFSTLFYFFFAWLDVAGSVRVFLLVEKSLSHVAFLGFAHPLLTACTESWLHVSPSFIRWPLGCSLFDRRGKPVLWIKTIDW
jgi:hypothetical protein